MKYILRIIYILPIFFFYISPAHAELLAVDQYLSVKLGYTGVIANPVKIKGSLISPQEGYKKSGYISTPNLALSVGTYYATEYVAVRGEVEYAVRFNAGTKISGIPTTTGVYALSLSNTIQTLLFNFFLDFNTRTFFVPYIGVGIGASFVDVTYSIENTKEQKLYIDFSWHVNLGAAFYIVPSLAIDVQARYSNFGEPRSGSGNPTRMIYTPQAIDVFIGIRYTL